MRKLVVHIGCAKGGSSAIQAGLEANCDVLAAQGVCVPSHDLEAASHVNGAQGAFFETFVQDRKAQPIPDLADRLDAQADERDAPTIVLSAENLCNPVGFEKVFAALRDRFDVSIVMYVRRQDDYLQSAWQQWIVKRGESLLAWMIACIGVDGDWLRLLTPWAETFGDDRVRVLVFDRQRLAGGDAFSDFCELLGVDASAFAPPGEVNAGLSPLLSRVVEGRDYLFDGPHDSRFYDSVRALAGDFVVKNGSGAPLFSVAEAAAIMSRYERSNEALRHRFLRQENGPLFPVRRNGPSRPEPAVDVAAFERELLQLQIFNLHKQVQALTDQPKPPPQKED